MDDKVILLVDDNDNDVELTLHALKKSRIRNKVVVVVDGAEAIEYLFGTGQYASRDTSVMPALVLLDLRLPKIGGLEVLKRMRLDARTAVLPVIVVSSSTDEKDLVESYRRGANSFVRKPVDSRKYGDAIKHLVFYWLHWNEPPPPSAEQESGRPMMGPDFVLPQKPYYDETERTLLAALETMGGIVEERDPPSVGHQARVTHLACALAEETGCDSASVAWIRTGGLVHDVGKIIIPAPVLSRPGKLSEGEFELIMMHPRAGHDIVRKIGLAPEIGEMIMQHHERLNGSGYPRGLASDAIMREARIMAVADVVEAMTSSRSHRPAIDIADALDFVRKNRGRLFDPEIVDACLKLFRDKGFAFPD